MNRASRFLRPLVEDEIEAVRTIEKQARIRYRDLGGLFVRAAEAPPIAAERFTTGETVVAELDDKPQGFVLLQPLRWVALCLQRIGQPRVCWSGDWANAHECSSTSRTAIEARRFIAGNLPHSILERAVVPASGLLADTGGTDRSRPPSDLGSARYVPRYDESRNPLETSSTDRMTRGHHNVLDNYTQADTCTGLDLARRVRPDGRHPGAQSLPDSDRNRLVATLVGPALREEARHVETSNRVRVSTGRDRGLRARYSIWTTAYAGRRQCKWSATIPEALSNYLLPVPVALCDRLSRMQTSLFAPAIDFQCLVKVHQISWLQASSTQRRGLRPMS